MYYTVYKITNIINKKIYIWVHKTNNLDDWYMGSWKHLQRAKDKYWIENFTKEYIQIFNNEKDMFDMESTLVNDDFVKRKDTYNINNWWFWWFNYINKNKLNYWTTYINKNKLNNLVWQCYISRNKMKKDKEYRKNIKIKISNKLKEYYLTNTAAFKWKTHSEETKKIMSEKKKGLYEWDKNPMFWLIWIYNVNQKENIRIKPEEIDFYLNKWWIKWRKMKF